jgi:purine-binding chemotaxis protein CheW
VSDQSATGNSIKSGLKRLNEKGVIMSDNFDKTRENDKNGDQRQFLTFAVNGEEYGVDIMTVREIKGWTETTRLPNSPEFMRGVMNLRGLIIPIFDLRARFRKELTKANAKHVVIILAIGERNIGVLVDAVSDILTVSADDIRPTPEMELAANTDFIGGLISLEKRMVVLLAVERLFGADVLRAANSLTQAA